MARPLLSTGGGLVVLPGHTDVPVEACPVILPGTRYL